jgi:flagellar biosynthesis protein FlhG
MIVFSDESLEHAALDKLQDAKKQLFQPDKKSKDTIIIPVASGKGGVGKTLFSVNLGVRFAAKNKRTLLIDLDLGGSNLHTYLGVKNKFAGIGEYLQTKNTGLDVYTVPTDFDNLDIITGDQLIPDLANIPTQGRERLIKEIHELDYDVIILDLGSGTHPAVLDFFLLSRHGVTVTIPTHGAILNAFSLLKTAVFRMFKLNFTGSIYNEIINTVKIKDEEGTFPNFWDILNDIAGVDSDAAVTFRELLDSFKPILVFNMVEDKNDVRLLKDLVDLTYNKLIIMPEVLGYMPKIKEAHQSVKKRTPFVNLYSHTTSAYNIDEMVKRLLKIENNKPMYDIVAYGSSLNAVGDEINKNPLFNPPPKKTVQRKIERPFPKTGKPLANPYSLLHHINNRLAGAGLG